MTTSDSRNTAPPPRPRAVVLPSQDDAETAAKRRLPQIMEEPEPGETGGDEPPPAVSARPRLGWGTLFMAGLGGFLSLAFWLWAEKTLRDLIAQSPALGITAAALLGLAGLALLVMLGRLLRDILRIRKVEALHLRVALAVSRKDLDEARSIAEDVMGLVSAMPATARGRATLTRALPELAAAEDVVALTEREILKPLDDVAAALVARAARQVSLVTAVSPRAIVDVAFVVFACLRMLKDIAATYGARPGLIGLMKLGRATLSHLLVTGGLAAGDALLQQIMGQGLAAKLSAKLGEGVLNGLLTARIGLSAIAQCRPMPFVEEKPPELKQVAGELFSGRDTKPGPVVP